MQLISYLPPPLRSWCLLHPQTHTRTPQRPYTTMRGENRCTNYVIAHPLYGYRSVLDHSWLDANATATGPATHNRDYQLWPIRRNDSACDECGAVSNDHLSVHLRMVASLNDLTTIFKNSYYARFMDSLLNLIIHTSTSVLHRSICFRGTFDHDGTRLFPGRTRRLECRSGNAN